MDEQDDNVVGGVQLSVTSKFLNLREGRALTRRET